MVKAGDRTSEEKKGWGKESWSCACEHVVEAGFLTLLVSKFWSFWGFHQGNLGAASQMLEKFIQMICDGIQGEEMPSG